LRLHCLFICLTPLERNTMPHGNQRWAWENERSTSNISCSNERACRSNIAESPRVSFQLNGSRISTIMISSHAKMTNGMSILMSRVKSHLNGRKNRLNGRTNRLNGDASPRVNNYAVRHIWCWHEMYLMKLIQCLSNRSKSCSNSSTQSLKKLKKKLPIERNQSWLKNVSCLSFNIMRVCVMKFLTCFWVKGKRERK